MKWLAIITIVLVAIVILVVVIGLLLPRDHVAALTARIPAPPQSVWAAITNPSQFPQWRTDVERVEILPSTSHGPSWHEFSKNGALTMVVDAATSPSRLVTRIADDGLPFGGSWEYRITPDGDNASRVAITERGSVYNPFFRFVSRFIIGHTATIDTYLRALGARFGSDVTPTVPAANGASDGI